MAYVWRFQQFTSASGRQAVTDWYESLTSGNKAAFWTALDRYAKMENWPSGICDPLTRPKKKKAKPKKKGWELRWVGGGVQHRLFGYYGEQPKLFVLVLGCTHKGSVWDPANAFETFDARLTKLQSGEATLTSYEIPKIFE